MLEWVLLLALSPSSAYTYEAHAEVQMENKQACLYAARKLSSYIPYRSVHCLNRLTGEVLADNGDPI